MKADVSTNGTLGIDDMVVRATDDYSMFARLEGNREIARKRIGNISKSVEKIGWMPIPIIINDRNEVIDGQGRLEYAEQNTLPVYYIRINGIGIKECESINASGANWTQEDYVKSFAERGNQNYIRIEELRSEFAGAFALSHILCATTGKKTTTRSIKDEKLIITPEMQEDARRLLSLMQDAFAGNKRIGSKDNVILSVKFILENIDVRADRLVYVIKEKADSINTASIETTIETLEYSYNYKLSIASHKSFLFEYKQHKKKRGCEEKAARRARKIDED